MPSVRYARVSAWWMPGQLQAPTGAVGPLSIRVGIATGLVVAGDLIGDGSAEEEAILGETPNLAARLQAIASPDAVVIASGTRSSAGASSAKTSGRTIKGLRRAGAGLAGDRAAVGHQPLQGGAAARRTPLVGREDDLAWLLHLWQFATHHRGHAALLVGEAGIGKSRVAEALREASREPRALRISVLAALRQPGAASGDPAHRGRRHIEHEDPAAAKLKKLSAWLAARRAADRRCRCSAHFCRSPPMIALLCRR